MNSLYFRGLNTLPLAIAVLFSGCDDSKSWTVSLSPNLENKQEDGSPYNPSTQSFIRGHHWLDSAQTLDIKIDSDNVAEFTLSAAEDKNTFKAVSVPLDQLMPRLNYRPASPPDAFDAFNLMMAEYSRNGIGVPTGQPGDTMSHFETSLDAEVPWTLSGDFQFKANPDLRPLRFAIVNNCLTPGLWELSATDRAGELYHSWFDMPEEAYLSSVAKLNGLTPAFVKNATHWRGESVPLDLTRLRTVDASIGALAVSLSSNDRAGFSSQGSRRKLAKGFVLVEKAGELAAPQSIQQMLDNPIHLSAFVPPGIYALDEHKKFDLSFLKAPMGGKIQRVSPLTDYTVLDDNPGGVLENGYIEMEIQLANHRLILGNLPLDLLVPAEEFIIHGFGVGILSASGFAERRAYLFSDGPNPSFAYVVDDSSGTAMAMNSHDLGIEQLYIRMHLEGEVPWWEITITSYERIVDLVRYRVEVPPSLHETMRTIASDYVSPLYYTYRDDNLR